MRVISWNMRRATADGAAWSYFEQLDPDVALLQEVSGIPAAIEDRFTTSYQPARGDAGKDQRFGTTVLVRGERVGDLNLTSPYEWVDQQLRGFSGNLVGGIYRTESYDQLRVLSVYLPAWTILKSEELAQFDASEVADVQLVGYDEIWLSEILWSALAHGRPSEDDPWIIGGDFNCSRSFDEKWGRTGSGQVLDRFERLGLRECLSAKQNRLVPTFKHSRGMVEDQIDHLYVTKSLYEDVCECVAGDAETVFGNSLSDHLPIITDIG